MTIYQTAVIANVLLGFLCAAWVHRTLKRNGQMFLEELFRNHPAAGKGLTRLLDIGYCLFNIGYVALASSTFSPWTNMDWRDDAVGSARAVSAALGMQLILLSIAHGINVWLFSRKVGRAMRNNEREIEALLRS